MNNKKTLNLALDIGNVCVKIDHQNYLRYLGVESVHSEVLKAAAEYECGMIDEESFFSRSQKFLPAGISRSQCENAFNSILIEAVPQMPELVATFADRNIRACFFSDISPLHLKRTEELFPAFHLVRDGVFSFRNGTQKPGAAMYRDFETRIGECGLYTDDRKDLIEAAKAWGWNAHLFTSAADLDRELIKLGY